MNRIAITAASLAGLSLFCSSFGAAATPEATPNNCKGGTPCTVTSAAGVDLTLNASEKFKILTPQSAGICVGANHDIDSVSIAPAGPLSAARQLGTKPLDRSCVVVNGLAFDRAGTWFLTVKIKGGDEGTFDLEVQ